MNRKVLVGGVVAGALLIICVIGVLLGDGLMPSPQPTATIVSPMATPMPPTATPIIWTLEAPIGTHALFGEDALTDESCVDCPAYDLVDGTQLTPLEGGCQQATWDPSYIYCHVRVLDGEYAGYEGWVNEEFIRK